MLKYLQQCSRRESLSRIGLSAQTDDRVEGFRDLAIDARRQVDWIDMLSFTRESGYACACVPKTHVSRDIVSVLCQEPKQHP